MESDNLQLTEIEKYCLEYITGYIAKRFLIKYFHLGTATNQSNDSNKSWTDYISKGYLITLSNKLWKCADIRKNI